MYDYRGATPAWLDFDILRGREIYQIVQQYPSCYIIFGCLHLNFGRLDDRLNVEIAGVVALIPF